MRTVDGVRSGESRASGAVVVTLAIAAGCWVLAIRQMNGMDMGVETGLGSFGFFIGVWALMMAAMMLPGAAPAVFRHARASARAYATPLFLGSYLAVWTLVGVLASPCSAAQADVHLRRWGGGRGGSLRVDAAQAAFPPQLPRAAGLGAGVRVLLRGLQHRADGGDGGARSDECHLDVGDRRGRDRAEAPARETAIDVPLALAIIALGVLVITSPGTVPGLTPPMSMAPMSMAPMSMAPMSMAPMSM